jgi:hypothetical protein
MAEARIKAGMWVSAALRLAFNEGRGGAVLRRGDADAGGILLVLRGEAGLKVLTQVTAADGEHAWMRATGPDPTTQEAADSYVERQIGRDPDLWVVEFDAPDYLPPFAGRVL